MDGGNINNCWYNSWRMVKLIILERINQWKNHNKMLFHIIAFTSFMIVIELSPLIQKVIASKTSSTIITHALTSYVSFLLAIYFLPNIIALISQKIMKNKSE